jgi:hypothetical protein
MENVLAIVAQEGMNAYRAGLPLSANPYTAAYPQSDALLALTMLAWHEGWRKAEWQEAIQKSIMLRAEAAAARTGLRAAIDLRRLRYVANGY